MLNLKELLFNSNLRERFLFTFGLLCIFRLGVFIPCFGINPGVLSQVFGDSMYEGVLGYINLFSGGALSKYSFFSLGIMPYISSSIIIQLLKAIVPFIGSLSNSGAVGRRKIEFYTKILTITLCFIQGFGLIFLLKSQLYSYVSSNPAISSSFIFDNFSIFSNAGYFGFNFFGVFCFILSIISGTMVLLWLGEQLNNYGIGNGISIIIFAGILARFPEGLARLYIGISGKPGSLIVVLILFILFFVVICFVVVEQKAERRIPINYTKRFVGNRMYSVPSNYIPFKINPSGVMPIIFASAVVFLPAQFIGLFGKGNYYLEYLSNSLSPGSLMYMFIYFILVVFFSYFYTSLYFDSGLIANRLRQEGGFIPGIRPGFATSEYIKSVVNYVTLPGSIFLGFIAILPDIIVRVFYFISIPYSFVYLMGGTSLLIIVGVSLDVYGHLKSYLVNYNFSD